MIRRIINKVVNFEILNILVISLQLALVPMIIRLKMLPVGNENLSFWNSNSNGDFFSYYKSMLTMSFAGIIAIFFIYRFIAKKTRNFKISYVIVFIGLYGTLIILSTLFSSYPMTSILGFPNRYEGSLTLISYLILFFSSFICLKNKKHISFILFMLILSATSICVIGILQYFGIDFFKVDFVQRLIIPMEYLNVKNLISFQNEHLYVQGNAIYSTLFNPNTFGLYMSMIFPLIFLLYVFTQNKYRKITLGGLSCLMFANVIGSFSRGSYLGITVSLIVTGIIFRRQLIERWRSITILIFIFLMIYMGMDVFNNGGISLRVKSLVSTADTHMEDRSIDKIKDFKAYRNELSIYSTNSVLNLVFDNGQISFTDENHTKIGMKQADSTGKVELLDSRYSSYSIQIIDNYIKIKKGKSFLYFAMADSRFIFLNDKGLPQNIDKVEKLGFQGIERLGSGRGYIWSRTLPILRHTLLLGTGPDTFAMEFPQNDYKGKLNFMYDAYVIIDKPHNMYLQAAVNTGVISALVLMIVFALYIWQSIVVLRERKGNQFYFCIGVSVFSAMLAYMITGIFTDSTVSVSPVFWILLGLGFRVNLFET